MADEEAILSPLDPRLARKVAYRDEADPLFFQWQRGEATEQDWLNKVSEIQTRFPDV